MRCRSRTRRRASSDMQEERRMLPRWASPWTRPSSLRRFLTSLRPGRSPFTNFALDPAMERRFAAAIRAAKMGKAAGPDKVPMEIFKLCQDFFAPLLFAMCAASERPPWVG